MNEGCDYWDAGWCYHPKGKDTGCVGIINCNLNKVYKHEDKMASIKVSTNKSMERMEDGEKK